MTLANTALLLRADEHHLESVRRALRDVLPSVREVEAAYLALEGPYATVRAIVNEADLALVERLVELSYELDARVPGLSFGVLPFEHQGRGAASMTWLGASPDYVRAG